MSESPMTREPESQERWEASQYHEFDGGYTAWKVRRADTWEIIGEKMTKVHADHIVADHNARLAPQDAGEWRVEEYAGIQLAVNQRDGRMGGLPAMCSVANSLTTSKREAEQRWEDEHNEAIEIHKDLETAQTRVTALEAALNGLWRYADHHSDCVLRRTVGPISECDCGFGQAESICENALKGEAPSE